MNLNNILDIVFDPLQNGELLNEEFLNLEKENDLYNMYK